MASSMTKERIDMTTLLQTAQPKTVTPAGFISYCYDDPNVGPSPTR